MKIRFSPSTGNFYPNEINYGSNVPSDIIVVDHEVYKQAMSRPAGTSFDIVDGNLRVLAPEEPSLSSQRAVIDAGMRAERAAILARLPGFGFEALATGDTAKSSAVLAAIKALKDLPEAPSIVQAKTASELSSAIDDTFASIREDAPAWLQSAFEK